MHALFVLVEIASKCLILTWIYTGLCAICCALLPNFRLNQPEMSFPQGLIIFPSLFPRLYNSIISLRVFSCLEGRCSAAEPCLFDRTGTIFQCPKSKLYSDQEHISYEQCVNEDVTASSYSSDPLLHARESVTIHGVPPPKRIKRIWKKLTKSKKEFSSRLFELAPDTFEHHQVLCSTS